MRLFVQVDDGKQFAVVIPEGLSPGDEFAVDEPDWSAGEGEAFAAKQEEVLAPSVVPPQNIPAATSSVSEDEELLLGWSAHVSSAGERCAIVATS